MLTNERTFRFIFQICVASKKKALQIYAVTEDKISLTKDISTSEIPLAMVGQLACLTKGVKRGEKN